MDVGGYRGGKSNGHLCKWVCDCEGTTMSKTNKRVWTASRGPSSKAVNDSLRLCRGGPHSDKRDKRGKRDKQWKKEIHIQD